MTTPPYLSAVDGLPPQTQLLTGSAVFTDAYAVIPRDVLRDIVTSQLPHWHGSRCWVQAKPLSGFATTFSQYLMEVAAHGGSEKPEPDATAETVLFMLEGTATLTLSGQQHTLIPGSYVYLPPAACWSLHNPSDAPCRFYWLRKAYQTAEGIDLPEAFVTHENEASKIPMANTEGRWSTQRFVDTEDLRHDMHVNIVNFAPGAVIPFTETHVMEHGLTILEGKAVYRLNQNWVEVQAGDFLWLRAFCPQACYAGGPGCFRYLLYKDVNRHMPLRV